MWLCSALVLHYVGWSLEWRRLAAVPSGFIVGVVLSDVCEGWSFVWRRLAAVPSGFVVGVVLPAALPAGAVLLQQAAVSTVA